MIPAGRPVLRHDVRLDGKARRGRRGRDRCSWELTGRHRVGGPCSAPAWTAATCPHPSWARAAGRCGQNWRTPTTPGSFSQLTLASVVFNGAMTTAISTLAGVLVGALTTYLIHKQNWVRESRRQVYANFIGECRIWFDSIERVTTIGNIHLMPARGTKNLTAAWMNSAVRPASN